MRPPNASSAAKTDGVRFDAFHLMSWPYLPADFGATHDTACVICENDLYDPKRGHEVYNRYPDELELADHLGSRVFGQSRAEASSRVFM